MNEEKIKKLIQSIQTEIEPPIETKDRIFFNVVNSDRGKNAETLTFLQSLFFVRPVRTAACLATIISAILYAALGNNYTGILTGFIGTR